MTRMMIFTRLTLSAVALSLTASLTFTKAMAGGAPPGQGASSVNLPTWQVLVSANRSPRLSHPAGLAIDERGESAKKWIYAVDTGNSRVIKFGTGGHYLGVWGARGTGRGRFQQPLGIAVDRTGDVYVADAGNNRVQKFGPQGGFLGKWGTKGSGRGQFDDPTAVAVGGAGNVFVADRGNKRIEKFSPSGQLLAVWPVFLPKGPDPRGFGPAGPYAIAVDAAGNVRTAVDTGQCSGGHCVMDYIVLESISSGGKVVRAVVGGNPYGPYSYAPVPGITGLGAWWQIGALIDSHGNTFATEWTSQNRISVTDMSFTARVIAQWQLPTPSGTSGSVPQGLALDSRGFAYVSDTGMSRLLKLRLDS